MNKYKKPIAEQLIYESYDRLLQAWGIDMIERDVETVYGQTHVILAGDSSNPPLVLFHGTADNSAMMWVYNAKSLAERYYVIAVDAVGGSGKSVANERYADAFDQVTWLDELLDALNLPEVNIGGVSYGGYLAYCYAIMRPMRVRRVVCMASAIPSSQFQVMVKMMTAFLPEALFPSEKNCRKLLRKLSGPNHSAFEDNEELMKHWYYLLKYFNNQSMMRHRIRIFQDSEFAGIRSKVLFLIGEYDRLSNYPKAIAKLESNQIPYKLVKDAGHAVNHEQAELINKEIIAFIGA